MISFVIPVVETDSVFWKNLSRLEEHSKNLGLDSFEIIVVPNGPTALAKQEYQNNPLAQSPHLRILPRLLTPGKGRALQEGFSTANGNHVFMIDADLPFELDFIKSASELLNQGVDLVYANRRHPESFFCVKVPTLHLAFRRHCLGLFFNLLARWILGVRSIDTQAGMKGLSKRLSKEVAQSATCPGFLFDLEIFLIAQTHQWPIQDLPVVFNLENEKSSVRLIHETFAILTWLPKLRWNLFLGRYGSLPFLARKTQPA